MWSRSAHVSSRLRLRFKESSSAIKIALAAAASVLVVDSANSQSKHDESYEGSEELVLPSYRYSPSWTGLLRQNGPVLDMLPTNRTSCGAFGMNFVSRRSNLRRSNTFKLMETERERETLENRYTVEWSEPIGEGSFGAVYQAQDKKTGEQVAVKKISKRATDNESFQREMDALLHIRKHGGHPNICGLRANFDQGDYYYLVLDLVSGGEMFDHLCNHGAYSEADAARMIREVASALAFLHGLNTVHGDLKPENCTFTFTSTSFVARPSAYIIIPATVLLSSEKSSAAVVKLVDFGSAQVYHDDEEPEDVPPRRASTATPAYSPPEFLERGGTDKPIEPSFDMWALGTLR
jgi:Protein kinase domain